ncbi:MAG: ROK family transcriptional regulator, partial [Jatrophihabitans sp.]|uniref:ROK family transcriptional regulator n=1 Tax=Jatrophihabitans sp. TaxID=1932789 RepID=UPI003F81C862
MDEVAGHGSLRTLRARNRLAVLQAVQAHPDSTRSDVARRTGLSSTTVASLVNDLLAGSVLVERDRRSKAVAGGRPAGTLGLHPELGSVIGIHLGHAGTRVLVAGLDGTVRAERAEDADVDHEPQQTLQTVARTAARLMDEVGIDPARLFGVGVAVAAPVLGTQQLASPPMLHDWAGVDIAGQLRALMGVSVQVGNDATLGALAEWRLGAGAGADDLVYVMLSEGVGAGLVIGGRLHQGASGAAGELGHVTVVPGGQICRCGNRGCLETVVGARALVTALAHTRPNSTVDDLLRSAAAGDPGTRRLLMDAGTAVGSALAAICVVLDPQRVIVGGAAADPDGVLVEGVRG